MENTTGSVVDEKNTTFFENMYERKMNIKKTHKNYTHVTYAL